MSRGEMGGPAKVIETSRDEPEVKAASLHSPTPAAAAPLAMVYVPTPLRRLTGGLSKVEAQGSNVAEMLDDLEAHYPGLRQRICEEDGNVKRFVNLFINGEEFRTLQGLRTPLHDGDEIFIIPAMSGGRRPPAQASGGDFSESLAEAARARRLKPLRRRVDASSPIGGKYREVPILLGRIRSLWIFDGAFIKARIDGCEPWVS